MDELISNLLRGSVSSVMYVVLLFTLTKSRFGQKTTILVAIFVFAINMTSTLWFYLYGDLTSLSRFTLLLFIVIGLAMKPLTRQSLMQWSFTFLTSINIAMMIIFLSFILGRLFPQPQYANTLLRLVLYLLVILLFQRFLQPMYQSIVDNWPIFSALVICIFLNLSYYFSVTTNIKDTLATNKWPLLLLVGLSIVAYGTVFYSMKKFLTMHALEIENMKIQKETGRLYEAALQMEKHANYDMLTGLPNRRFFFERLEHIVKHSQGSQTFAVLYIDLDGFKSINDTFGHQHGDKVLMEVGNRLSHCIRETDFVARLGGDEFAVITSDFEGQSKVEQFARRVHAVLQETIDIDTFPCSVNASIGVAIHPDAGSDSETLLRAADAAMYEVKRTGKGGIKISAVK
ncbi:hypothetical protein SDC9_123064 [bioreactor metagenome]|jgi:diguanylate cyclase (GGDEF)-like protein|uniref:GGDEF domain-containing protein n=2 Tax=root TaxID=1 RepID=A0ABY4D8B0_9SPIR|nr:GGDEF domain-containing protein [Sphaerochaeta associata]MDD3057455.1 GGDEF domain-containing protein [Sphaerochaeta sp.]MEA5029683.1 GGDEF domain-containing protein [Sphaerochaeta associata]UOM50155.1 GGDEF domain-containing protein [Sphaerochaeta associata]SMP44214.1 diguanylate cyclase (GGDEF) domain-containing protein [Sphaerochaeta associata]